MSSGIRPTIRIEGKTIREIAAETGIREATIRARYRPGCAIADVTSGYTDGRTNDIPMIEGKTLAEIAREYGIPKGTLYARWHAGARTLDDLTRPRYSRK